MVTSRKKRSGFTLIELLVVIAIIAILIALLVPAVQKVRDAAARTQCINNLKNIGLALHGYHDTYKMLPPGCAADKKPDGSLYAAWGSSWKVFVLPFIEQGALFSKWQFPDGVTIINTQGSGYQNSNNTALVNNVTIPVYRCPSTALPPFYTVSYNNGSIEMFTTYTGISGSYIDTGFISVSAGTAPGTGGIVSGGGVLFPNSKVALTGITDGTSNTVMVGEQADHLRDLNGAPILPINNGNTNAYGALTSQGPHGWTMGAGNVTVPPIYNGNDNRSFNCTTTRYEINKRFPVGTTGSNSTDYSGGISGNAGANIPYSSTHAGGANFCFADGTVRMLMNSMPLATLCALSSRAGGESVTFDQ